MAPRSLCRERKRAENYNKLHNIFFLNCNRHFGNLVRGLSKGKAEEDGGEGAERAREENSP